MRLDGINKDKVVFIVGPTAIGKTRLSVKLAKRIKGEIVSCDSMQIYKGMAILSQAPSPSERSGVRHYLIGLLSPAKEYSAAIFIKKSRKIIASILKRKKTPIVVGGSGLYVKALIDGLFPSPKCDLKFRQNLARLADKNGTEKLHERLAKIDPESAANIHPNDRRRIIRSLEIFHSTGKTMTELKSKTKGIKDLYDVRIFGLTASREKIYSNINKRVLKMFKDGAEKEVMKLNKKALSRTAQTALGIKEITSYLNGERGISAAMEELAKNTRNFAKRQLTWFRPDERIDWLDVSVLSDGRIINNILKRIK